MAKVKIYGADWCPMTTRSLDLLKRAGVDFEYVDVEQDGKASEWVKAQNGGRELKPTIDIEGEIVAEPSDAELERVLAKHELIGRQT